MTVHILNGLEIAATARHDLKHRADELSHKLHRSPCLAVIQVGNNPASTIYVNRKIAACQEVGITSKKYAFDHMTQEELIDLIQQLNENSVVDGILLQLPLPAPLSAQEILDHIHPSKDVDGLHPMNQGLLQAGRPLFVPCTPMGCLHLIRHAMPHLSGKKAVIVGRSVLVGKPLAALLLQENATVTIAHSYTQDLEAETKTADIVVMAAGVPNLLSGDMIKPGAVVIDVGISRVNERVCGDVDFESTAPVAGFITPVPGGVGPMTVTFLLHNTIHAASLRLPIKKQF